MIKGVVDGLYITCVVVVMMTDTLVSLAQVLNNNLYINQDRLNNRVVSKNLANQRGVITKKKVKTTRLLLLLLLRWVQSSRSKKNKIEGSRSDTQSEPH
jgi:hypothetical protein